MTATRGGCESAGPPQAPPDLRLGSAAVGAWAGVVAGGLLPRALCWLLAGSLVVAAAVLRRTAAFASFAALLAAGMLVATIGRDSLSHGPVADLARRGGSAHVELTVAGDPYPLPAKPHLPPEVALHARLRVLETVRGRWTADLPVVVIAPAASWQSLLPSTRVAATAGFEPARGGDAAALLVVRHRPVLIRGPSAWQRWAGAVRAGLRRAAARLPVAERGLLPGLVVGDTSGMPAAETADFQRAGLTHLTAVSGANLAVVVAAVFWLLRWTPLRIGGRALVTAGALLGFVLLARPTPSVLRAAGMGLLALAAIGLGRQRALLPALLATSTALVLFSPSLATSAGFALSVLATLALLALAPGWTSALRQRLPPRVAPLAPVLTAPLAAQLVCMPVIAAISGTVSLAAVPANVLALPAVPITTVLGLLAAIASQVWPAAAGVLCTGAGIGCHWLVLVAHTAAHLPSATVAVPSGTAGLVSVTAVTLVIVGALRTTFGRRTLVFAVTILAGSRLAGLH